MKQLRRMKKLTFSAIFLILTTLVFPFTVPAMAQATAGSLRGVVTDQNGAVVVDADVTARNTGTGVDTKSKSNAEGLYNFPNLLPGTYLVIVEKSGFKRQEFQGVNVIAGQVNTLDAILQTGQITETVTVTASGAELVQKEQAQISNTFESRKVADLPSNIAGGGIDTLALLAPGIVPGFGNVNSNGTTLSVNGNRARSNNFTIDGADNNDLSIGGPNYFVDNQDIVAEFQVITNNFSAEYGRNQGAIVNIITKAGTNDFHGTAFWAHRDRKNFDSLTNIERRGGGLEDPTPFLYNVYSGTLGGPVWKDKIFFFASYQRITGREIALGQSGNPTIAPEELSRLESLPGFASNPVLQVLRNFSAFAITDLGNLRERSDRPRNETITLLGQTFRVAYPEREFAVPFNAPEFSARGDWTINDRNSIWFRQLYQSADNQDSLGGSNGFTGDIPVESKISTFQWTSQLSGTSVNEFRFNFNRLDVIFGGGCDGQVGCITDPLSAFEQSLANISFTGFQSSGGASLQTIGAATNLPQGRTVDVYQFTDNFSKTLGKHQLKMGADIRRLDNTVPFLPNANGAFRFPSRAAVEQNRPSFVNLAAGTIAISYKETDQFYYFNDDWRIKDNLTLNLGVRYEYIGQPINTLHDLSLERESDPATAIWLQSLPIETRTFPKLKADKNNFAPRIGFAWRPRFGDTGIGRMLFGEQDSTVIRGGYSIAYDPPFYNLLLNISTSSPLVFLNTTLNPAAGNVVFPLPSGTPTGAAVQEFARSNQIIAVNTFDPRFFSQTIVSRDFYLPYAQQFSFGIQREISRDNVVEARWVSTKGTGLFQTLNRNPRIDRLLNGFTANVPGIGAFTFPGFPQFVPAGLTPQVAGQGACVDNPATVTLNEAAQCNGRILPQGLVRSRENTATSIYHSLQTRYQGRVANQLNWGMSYTWSKALDSASEVFSFQESAAPQNPFGINDLEKSFSGFDRRHAFSLNFIWDVPLFRQQEGVVGNILGGWQLNGTYFLANGLRFTPSQFFNLILGPNRSYGDPTWDGGFLGLDSLRPFRGNPDAPRSSVAISQVDAAMIFGVPVQDINGFWSLNELQGNDNLVRVTTDQVRYIFNGPGAARIFGTPFGTSPRGIETGKRLNNLNLGVFKNFRIKENMRLRFSFDMFNALNHPNPGVGFIAQGAVPDIFVDDAGLDDGFNDLTGVEYARRAIQFGLKFIF
jgi:hypothetical protein